ncbi:MAG: TonB-dependent receptor, partial [Verrucomicrobiota bacterium]
SPWWRLRGGYSFIEENIREKPGKVDVGKAIAETSGLEQQFSIRSSMELPGRVELDAGLRWVDRLTFISAGNVGYVPSYFGLDVRVGWHATRNLEFSLVGQNLLYDHRAQFAYPNLNQHQIERSVYGKVTWSF